MKAKTLFIWGALRLLLAVVAGCLTTGNAEAQPPLAAKAARYHPTRLLARLRSDAPGPQPAALSMLGLEITSRFHFVPGLVTINDAAGAAGKPAGDRPRTLHERMEALRATGLFEYVEPDYIRAPAAVPTDEAFVDGRHWNLQNTGLPSPIYEDLPGVAGMDIDAVRAWNITTGSTDVIVAVVDSGIRYTHRDLAPNMWRNPGEIPGNGIDDDGNGYIDDVFGIDAITGSGDPMDDLGHGTLVAGIIGAAANNGGAAVGVCWNVRLMAVRIFPGPDEQESASAYDSLIVAAIDYASSHGARLINASWGSSNFSHALFDAIAAAGSAGTLFVAAAGNGLPGENADLYPCYPAAHALDCIVSVAGFRRDGELDWYSNYGAGTVDLGAPGFEIFSTSFEGDDEYAYIGGTSAAAPHVSGVAALLLAHAPSLTVAQLRDRLLGTAVPMESLQSKTVTGGRLSAYQALTHTADGNLEMLVYPGTGGTLFAGRAETVEVRVTDLDGVAGATVTGTVAGLPPLVFADDGIAPDRASGDAIYTAAVDVSLGAASLELEIDATAAGFTPAHIDVFYSVLAPPPNDDFADRRALPAEEYAHDRQSNVGATREPGEPVPAADSGATGGRSVWWTWTAPRSGLVSIDTDEYVQSRWFDTILGVYTGDALASLVEVASNDDWVPGAGGGAVSFEAIAGTAYQIAVDGFGGDTGDVDLDVIMRPANDDFADRVLLSGSSILIEGRQSGATVEPGEPDAPPNGNTVWWKWSAPAEGLAIIAAPPGTPNGLVVHVFGGDVLAELNLLAGNSEYQFDTLDFAPVAFLAQAGVEYSIQVDSFSVIGEPVMGAARFALSLDLMPLTVEPAEPDVGAGGALSLSAPTGPALHYGWRRGHGLFYQWRHDGMDIPGATASTYTLPSTQLFHAGAYTVVVTQGDVSLESAPAQITVSDPPSSEARLLNLSTRALCLTGDEVLVPGFVIIGDGTKRLLVRAIGPRLADWGVSDVLPDPRLLVRRKDGDAWIDIAANDDWDANLDVAELLDAATRVGAFDLVPGSADAALLLDAGPGQYGVEARGAGDSTGVAMVEIYDADSTDAGPGGATLVNISNRGFAGAGGQVMIPGFVVSEEGPKTFLARAVGPTLAQWNIDGFLPDPHITVFHRVPGPPPTEQIILTNDNWGENGDAALIVATAAQVGAFPLPAGSSDAAFVITLQPGIYSIHASGAEGDTGIALVELYVVP